MGEMIVFEYQGSEVVFDATSKMWNLTAMHRAVGSDPVKAPAQWTRTLQAQEIIEALARRLNCADMHNLLITRRGRDGGTWAHWQIAAIYAHYLNPDFYLQCNEWAMERQQQIAQDARPTPDRPLLTSSVEALDAAVEAISRTLDACFIISKGNGYLRDYEIMQVLEYHGMLPHLHIPVLIERRKANAFYLSAVSTAMILRGVHYSPIKHHVIYLGIAPRDPVIAEIIEDTRGEKAYGKRTWQRMKKEAER